MTDPPNPADALHNIIDDTDHSNDEIPTPQDPNQRLNTTRIRNLATLRRTTIRQRSWNFILAALCLVAAFQLPRPLARFLAHHLHLPPQAIAILTLLGAALGIIAAAFLLTKVLRLTRDLNHHTPPQENPNIDFTPLQSGQQFADNLATMHPPSPENPKEN